MALYRIIYSSRPNGFDQIRLNGILVDARRRNEQNEITGALLGRKDLFIQLLEGPQAAVKETMERVSRDYRHGSVKIHSAQVIYERMFGGWSMLHDPEATSIWSMAEVANGALDRATKAEVEGFFTELRQSRTSA